MDKLSRKVYKFLLSQPGHGFQSGFYDPPFDRNDYVSACEYLVRCGYAQKIPRGYALTHEGVHKRELEIRAFWKAFFSKYITGIVTGVISTMLAQLLIAFLRAKLGI